MSGRRDLSTNYNDWKNPPFGRNLEMQNGVGIGFQS